MAGLGAKPVFLTRIAEADAGSVLVGDALERQLCRDALIQVIAVSMTGLLSHFTVFSGICTTCAKVKSKSRSTKRGLNRD